MPASAVSAEEMLDRALVAARLGDDSVLAALEQLSTAVYVTDAHGVITHFNQACIDLAGRTPQVGADRWCVTWKLFTEDGQALPHDECPMAVAIKEKRSIRGVSAVAERPDGERINFEPWPTPLFDEAGELVGAVNMLVDITDLKRVEFLRGQAERCRRLASSVGPYAGDTLKAIAADYDRLADKAVRAN